MPYIFIRRILRPTQRRRYIGQFVIHYSLVYRLLHLTLSAYKNILGLHQYSSSCDIYLIFAVFEHVHRVHIVIRRKSLYAKQ